MYEKLFAEGKIGPVVLKNRFVVPAMGTTLVEYDGHVTDAFIEYWVERAKGGYGLLITEYNGVSQQGGANLNYVREIRKAVKIPIITVGRFTDPVFMDSVMEDGDVDFIAQGRQSLADPYFPQKLMNQEEDESIYRA